MEGFLKKQEVYWIAIISSVFVSLIIFAWQQPLDTDAFVYFAAAKAYLGSGFHAAMESYSLPLYSILLALLSKFCGISFLVASNILNVFFDTIIVVWFIKILELLGATKREMFFGLFFILFFPYLAHFRHMPMRDHGYLAFILIGLSFLISYYREGKLFQSILWGFFAIFSLLFRVEGGIFIVFAPLVIICNRDICFVKRLKRLFFAYILFLAVAVFALGFIFLKMHHLNQEGLQDYLGRILSVKAQIFSGLWMSYHGLLDKARLIKPIVADNQTSLSFVFLVSGLMGIYFKHLLNLTGVLYFFLGVGGLFFLKKRKGIAVIYMFILINILISFGFITQMFFLSKRYILLLSILLLIGAPFLLNEIFQQWKERSGCFFGSEWLFPLIVLWMIIIALSSVIYFGPSKAYLINGGYWLHKNVPANAMVCNNDEQSNFYADVKKFRLISEGPIKAKTLAKCDYLAISLPRENKVFQKEIELLIKGKTPLKVFKGSHGGKTIIYKLQ